ncbi:MAG: hypothetical protein WKF35_00250 [Ferruginibacter sp.]
MKTTLFLFLSISLSLVTFAQKEEPDNEEDFKNRGFKKENLFTGGSVSLGFSNGTTSLGLIPHFGYSLNKYVDVAVSMNFNYTSQRDNVVLGDKIRQTIIGPGAFVRLFPVKFLFAQAQYEHNFIKLKYLPADNSGYVASTENYNGNSLLVGAGYSQGREDGNSFYYLSLMFDVAKSKYSPYKDELGRNIPIIRAGLNIALFQNR